jgi:signal transduction histidine kinase/DNA-binding response OmpR family regulator
MSIFQIPAELSEDPRVRYDAAAARLLYPVSGMVGLLYAALAIMHPFFVSGRNGVILSITAATSAVVMLTLAWTRRGNDRIDYAPAQLALVFIVLIVNSTMHLFLSQENLQSSNMMLVTIAIGMAVLQTGWYLALTALTWLGWILGMLQIDQPYWSHWVIAMLLATLIGSLMRNARRSSIDGAAGTMAQQHFLLEEAETLAANRQNLLATISHDIRTPVTGIVGMVDLLLQRPLDARTRELVVGVQHSADGLTTLLNNLLDLARVEAGKLELNSADASLEETINEVVQMVGPLAQRKHVPLIAALDPDVASWIHTDSSRLKQILLNLVSNAVKFTESGAVTLVARPLRHQRTDWVDIAVTDTGPGMTQEELATIFEAFVQASSGVHKKHGGSGFGLAIAQRLTIAMGGDLTVTSEPGVGTTFHVRLPVGELEQAHDDEFHVDSPGHVVITGHPIAVEAVGLAMRRRGRQVDAVCTGAPDTLHVRVVSDTADPEATRARDDEHRLVVMGPTATVAASPTAGEYLPLPWIEERLLEVLGIEAPQAAVQQVLALPTDIRILLAEDDMTNRQLIAEMLRRMGADIHTVSDGAAAVEEVAGGAYDLVLLDLNMPVMDGLEAVKVIRDRLASIDDLAVLALTADPGWIDRSVLSAAGFNGYVMKPTTMAELHVGITKALERMGHNQPVAVEATPAATSAESLDVGKLQQLASDLGGNELVIETLGLYLEELPTRLVALHRDMESGSADEVRATAHSLKGASGMLGAMRLHELCRRMETEASMDLLFETYGEAERVEMLMRAYLEELGSPAGSNS